MRKPVRNPAEGWRIKELSEALRRFVSSHDVTSPHGRIIHCNCVICNGARAVLSEG